jgi:hypothetical protein
MKQRNLMYILQNQTLNNEETPNQTSTNLSYDNSQLRSLIENGSHDATKSQSDSKLGSMIQELHKELL